ncbi:MAG: 6,7-dimethyl-8-ribityllumazine synthase [Alphaproteobacteria bacterium]|nr:6,7-dimethyl-8-ribityllumazine synthase [Alphaproteobacteria bacterium]
MKTNVMIVRSPYYEDITENLTRGAVAYLKENDCNIEVFDVVGALEIPLAIKYGISSAVHNYNAYIALGCVIRGETSHYDIVAEQSARGLMDIMLKHDVPIGNGILTCDTKEQAMVRADPSKKNKGRDAAQAALSLLKLKKELHAV